MSHVITSSYNHFIIMRTHRWPYGPCYQLFGPFAFQHDGNIHHAMVRSASTENPFNSPVSTLLHLLLERMKKGIPIIDNNAAFYAVVVRMISFPSSRTGGSGGRVVKTGGSSSCSLHASSTVMSSNLVPPSESR